MWRRIGITLATGLVLTGAYQGYSVFLSPAVRIPLRTSEPEAFSIDAESHRPTENMRVAEAWLKHLPWTGQAKYLMRTDEMFVFTNEWTPRGDQGQIRFRPFAAVWLTKDKEGVEQAVTVCAESALLKFASTFQIDNPQPGRVTGGSLDGEVRISGPDGLKISGENFYFSEGTSSIFSPKGNHSPVEFEFGENRGKAGSVLVRLIKSATPIAKDRPNIVGVESIELSKNVKMQLKLEDDPQKQPVTIKCTGFEYRVESRTAIYDQNVDAYRRDAKTPSKIDRLMCDRLTVQFEPKPPTAAELNKRASIAVAGKNGEYQQIERKLQFRSLKAEGKLVKLRSDEESIKAAMSLLTYDAATRTIEMTSPQAVKVEQKRNRLQCPHIRLVLGPENSLQEALCQGAGWLETYDEITGEIAFAADWMKQLRKSTDAETQLDLIELEQEASFRQPSRESGMVAQLIRLWFTPPAGAAGEREIFRLGGNGNEPDPKRLLALQGVALVSPQMEADTEQLEVVFDDGTSAAAPAQPALSRRPRSSIRLTTARPEDAGAVTDAESSKPPLMIAADKIRVRMVKPNDKALEPEVKDIWTTGHVRVEQPAVDDGKPLVVTGEKLHVENNSETDQVVHVYGEPGRPAHIRDEQQQLHIEGQLIHFDRHENLAWVDGPGLLQLPVTKTLDMEDLDEPQLLDVWWKDRMDFDGLLATFDGNVRAKLAHGTMQCQSMQVALSKRISFTDSSAAKNSPELQSITCRDRVEFANKRYLDDGRLMEIQLAKGYEFHLDHASQHTEAKGPGWMQMWHRRSSKRAGLAVTDSVQANRTSREPATEWEYTRVDFAGRMEGHIARQQTMFHDRVEVLHGPVKSPSETFDQHHIPEGGGAMRCKKLEVIQTLKNAEGKSFMQLLGAGDTMLSGRGFEGQADQISYDETKGQFILRSFGNRTATIWQQNRPGVPDRDFNAQQILFIPATHVVQVTRVTRATSGEGSQ